MSYPSMVDGLLVKGSISYFTKYLIEKFSYDFDTDQTKVLLCFGESEKDSCHLFDGDTFTTVASSSKPHFAGRLANYHGKAFVTGSITPNNAVTEVFDGSQWEELASYPFWGSVNSYGVVSLPDQVVIFGGRLGSGGLYSDQIASFKERVFDIFTPK